MTGLWVFLIVVVVLSILVAVVVGYFIESVGLAVTALVVCLLASGALTWWNYATFYANDHWATCHVTGKDRGANEGSYRIYTSDCGQLSNEDSVLRQKFDSADVWQKIPDKGLVTFEIAGSRIGPMSQFPNVFAVGSVQG